MNTYYVSFGIAHPLDGYYVVIHCKDLTEAYKITNIQFARFGEIYTQKEWESYMNIHGETMDSKYGWKLAAVISDYKYADNYKD